MYLFDCTFVTFWLFWRLVLADVAFVVIVTFENQTLKSPDIHAMQKATESFIVMKAILKSEQKSCNDTRMTIIKKVFNVSQRLS